jgi:hypothetical protein
MMNDQTITALKQKVQPPKVQALMEHARHLVDISRGKMAEYYDMWDNHHATYNGHRCLDKNDKKAIREGRPTKQVVPMTYAKVQTFKSFCDQVLWQRPRFFELTPTGIEDEDLREQLELCVDRDVQRNKFKVVIDQFLTDLCKFDLAITQTSWKEDVTWITEEVEEGGRIAFGKRIGASLVPKTRKVIKSQGNYVENISPYKWFPDWRVPVKRFHEGEFCADEACYSVMQLRKQEIMKEVAGIDQVRHLEQERATMRSKISRLQEMDFEAPGKAGNGLVITRIQMRIVPFDFDLIDGEKLGQEKHPVLYHVWIANDQRVIRLEPMNYLHDEFLYDVAQFENDEHEFINQGLAGIVDKMQETIDWFINARVESVTRTIDNQLIVDPLGVEMSTVLQRSRVIQLKKGAARTGVDRYVKQMQVQDVTTNHLADVKSLTEMLDYVTGVNENLSGQYNRGRRSATEARVVSQGASGRQLSIIGNVWVTAFASIGRKMMINLRQGLTQDFWQGYVGMKYPPEMFPLFKGTPEALLRQEDFFIFDGTLPSDKQYLAQSLQEILGMLMQSPEAIGVFGISPKLLMQKIYELRGVPGLETFSIQRDPALLQLLQNGQQQQQPNPEGAA